MININSYIDNILWILDGVKLQTCNKYELLPPTARVIHLCSVDTLKYQFFLIKHQICKSFPTEAYKPYLFVFNVMGRLFKTHCF